jgi:hypothetical protein
VGQQYSGACRTSELPARDINVADVAVVQVDGTREIEGGAAIPAIGPGIADDQVIPAIVHIDGSEVDAIKTILAKALFNRALAVLERRVATLITGSADSVHWIDLRGPYLAVVEVHRTGETMGLLTTIPTANRERAHHPVTAARIVVDSGPLKDNARPRRAEAGASLLPDIVLADPDGLIRCEPAVDWGVTIPCPVTLIRLAVAWIWLMIALIPPAAVLNGRRCDSAAPRELEGVNSSASFRVFNADYRHPAIARVANKFLTAATVDAREAKFAGIGGQWPSALEAAPLRRLTGQITHSAAVAPNVDLRGAVDKYLDGALSPIRISAADDFGTALKRLSSSWSGDEHKGYGADKKTFIHRSPRTCGSISGAVLRAGTSVAGRGVRDRRPRGADAKPCKGYNIASIRQT